MIARLANASALIFNEGVKGSRSPLCWLRQGGLALCFACVAFWSAVVGVEAAIVLPSRGQIITPAKPRLVSLIQEIYIFDVCAESQDSLRTSNFIFGRSVGSQAERHYPWR